MIEENLLDKKDNAGPYNSVKEHNINISIAVNMGYEFLKTETVIAELVKFYNIKYKLSALKYLNLLNKK